MAAAPETASAISAIHAACETGNAAAAQRLLESNPEAAWERDSHQRLPVHLAAEHGHEAVVRLLLQAAPAAAMAPDGFSWLPLHYAAVGGHEAVARLLLEVAPAAAMATGGRGKLPLHWAAHSGHEAVVRLLLEAAPAAATAESVDGIQPLHYAAARGHEAVVRLLLEAAPAAATAAQAFSGWLPLHWAADGNHDSVVRFLVDAAPATAAATDSMGHTPLRLALVGDRAAAARALLSTGPAATVLATLAAAGADALPLFPDFLLAPGRLPLAAADWALVPSPCPGIGRALPAALACGTEQAAQVVRRLEPADRERLRTAALCLVRLGLPLAAVEPILAQLL